MKRIVLAALTALFCGICFCSCENVSKTAHKMSMESEGSEEDTYFFNDYETDEFGDTIKGNVSAVFCSKGTFSNSATIGSNAVIIVEAAKYINANHITKLLDFNLIEYSTIDDISNNPPCEEVFEVTVKVRRGGSVKFDGSICFYGRDLGESEQIRDFIRLVDPLDYGDKVSISLRPRYKYSSTNTRADCVFPVDGKFKEWVRSAKDVLGIGDEDLKVSPGATGNKKNASGAVQSKS